MASREDHPIVSGLSALVAVSLVVAAVAGLGALVGSRALGLSGGETVVQGTQEADMYIPEGATTRNRPAARPGSGQPAGQRARRQPKQAPIQLVASPDTVSSFEQIYLTGTYADGDGAILQVERREAGSWGPFPVTVSVSEGGFRTYIQTSRVGKNVFRVRDSDSDALSNVVTVTVR